MHRAVLPEPPEPLMAGFGMYAEEMSDDDSRWWPKGKLTAFLDSLSAVQSERVMKLKDNPFISYRTAYRALGTGNPRGKSERMTFRDVYEQLAGVLQDKPWYDSARGRRQCAG